MGVVVGTENDPRVSLIARAGSGPAVDIDSGCPSTGLSASVYDGLIIGSHVGVVLTSVGDDYVAVGADGDPERINVEYAGACEVDG